MAERLSIYLNAMKNDIILLIAMLLVLFLSSGMWLGFPLFFFMSLVPLAAPVLFPLTSAMLFSIGFLYTSIHAAGELHKQNPGRSVLQWTMYYQLVIIGAAFISILFIYVLIVLIHS
ncbi:hypothetical protein MM300_19200 [Evansella sp. LMS18]|uniref:hypothetical protein n=1 Tax=Evansella sp. LMS18 TaxID=2924033 RepID=UPI0020D0B0F4|nr:hypothetical protein [Evansella sp. LMS18]UTR09983.1 hypothetical protein MM300_19200 [Evansella sp. LMS18]